MKYKTTIMGIAQSLLIYSLAKGYIGNDEAILISGITTSFGFGINYINNRKG